jgi:hypothetical protein
VRTHREREEYVQEADPIAGGLSRGRFVVDASNIDRVIRVFVGALDEWRSPLPDWSDPLKALLQMKRGKAGFAIYPEISLFEVGNRVCSDLTLLFGVKRLLRERSLGSLHIPYDRYSIALGTASGFDIEAEADGCFLIGEVFHVASGYHPLKLKGTVAKLTASHPTRHRDTNERALRATHRVIIEGRDGDTVRAANQKSGLAEQCGIVVLDVAVLESVAEFRASEGPCPS